MDNEMVDNRPKGPILEVIHEAKMSEIDYKAEVLKVLPDAQVFYLSGQWSIHVGMEPLSECFASENIAWMAAARALPQQSVKEPSQPVEDTIKEIFKGVKVNIGLRAQGHLDKVTQMRGEGKTWDEIGRAIGWQGSAVEEWYAMEAPAPKVEDTAVERFSAYKVLRGERYTCVHASDYDPITVGPALRELRKSGGLSQAKFAQLVGLARTHISQMECGHAPVTFQSLALISQATKVPIWKIIRKAELLPAPIMQHGKSI